MPDQNFSIDVQITDNSPQVLAAVPVAIARALWAMGVAAENHAKANETRIDTGRLRGSITHQEDKTSTVIGTNVEYAAAHEFGTSRGLSGLHYLKNAVANNTEEYKGIVKQSMANI